MTREEKELAIEELQGCIIAEEHGKDGKPNGNVTCELTKDTIDLAIKALEQEPFINKPCVSSGVCEHDKQKALDKIRAEIKAMSGDIETIADVLAIIDKYKSEMEEV